MLMPIRTFDVVPASQGTSGQPWNHSPREDTGKAFGNSSIIPNEYWSSWRSEASGTTIRSSVQTESKSSSSARLVSSASSLTVTLSRKFGRYRASFMRDSLIHFVSGSRRGNGEVVRHTDERLDQRSGVEGNRALKP